MRGGRIHRLQRRGAEPVDLLSRNAFVIVGHQHGGAADVAALFADRLRTAKNDVIQ